MNQSSTYLTHLTPAVKKLLWHNYKVYTPSIINERMNFIKSRINYKFPMSPTEKEVLTSYANKIQETPYQIYSFSNMIRIQNDINNSTFYKRNVKTIRDNFTNTMSSLPIESAPDKIDLTIKNFMNNVVTPANLTIDIIKSTPIYKELDLDQSTYIQTIRKTYRDHNIDVLNRSKKFEIDLENFLKDCDIDFKNEADIIREKIHKLTPDVLLTEPIEIIVNDENNQINWLDAKNYTLVNIPFIIKSLHKQANKYNKAFGKGAFVFHYGFDESIKIPDTLILDGSGLVDIDKNYCHNTQ